MSQMIAVIKDQSSNWRVMIDGAHYSTHPNRQEAEQMKTKLMHPEQQSVVNANHVLRKALYTPRNNK